MTVVVATEVRQVEVPAEMRSRACLSRIDYEDAFLVPLAGIADHSAREWAEETLERAPAGLRRSVLAGWATIGFALDGIPTAGSVLGWRIRREVADLAILGAASPLGLEGELVFERRAGSLAYATFVALDGARARTMWERIGAAHPPVVSALLSDLARRHGPNAGTPWRKESATPAPRKG